MSWRCCKCKHVCEQQILGVFNTEERCIYCGHDEYFWFEYYEYVMKTIRPENRKVKQVIEDGKT